MILARIGRLFNFLFSIPSLISVSFLVFWHWLSEPLFGQQCRFTPSCSVYAKEAIQRHGFVRGWWLASLRILRCHPACKGGHDPVPEASS